MAIAPVRFACAMTLPGLRITALCCVICPVYAFVFTYKYKIIEYLLEFQLENILICIIQLLS